MNLKTLFESRNFRTFMELKMRPQMARQFIINLTEIGLRIPGDITRLGSYIGEGVDLHLDGEKIHVQYNSGNSTLLLGSYGERALVRIRNYLLLKPELQTVGDYGKDS